MAEQKDTSVSMAPNCAMIHVKRDPLLHIKFNPELPGLKGIMKDIRTMIEKGDMQIITLDADDVKLIQKVAE